MLRTLDGKEYFAETLDGDIWADRVEAANSKLPNSLDLTSYQKQLVNLTPHLRQPIFTYMNTFTWFHLWLLPENRILILCRCHSNHPSLSLVSQKEFYPTQTRWKSAGPAPIKDSKHTKGFAEFCQFVFKEIWKTCMRICFSLFGLIQQPKFGLPSVNQRTLSTEWKHNPQNGRKILANHISRKEFLPRIYKELPKLKIKQLNIKCTKDSNRHFCKEDIQMTNKLMRRYSISLISTNQNYSETLPPHTH